MTSCKTSLFIVIGADIGLAVCFCVAWSSRPQDPAYSTGPPANAQAMPCWDAVTLLSLGEDLVLYILNVHVCPFLKVPIWLLAEPLATHKEAKTSFKDCLVMTNILPWPR